MVLNCFRPSWKIDVLSNEWPLGIKSLLLVVVLEVLVLDFNLVIDLGSINRVKLI